MAAADAVVAAARLAGRAVDAAPARVPQLEPVPPERPVRALVPRRARARRRRRPRDAALERAAVAVERADVVAERVPERRQVRA